MKLVAEIMTGSLFYVEVGENATVADLKNQTCNQENLPRDRLILMLNADERYLLDKDEVPLKDYGVEESSHIYIFFQPLDEGSSSASPSLTPKESASSEPSPSMEIANEPPIPYNENEDEPSNEANEHKPSTEAYEPSHSVGPSSAHSEE